MNVEPDVLCVVWTPVGVWKERDPEKYPTRWKFEACDVGATAVREMCRQEGVFFVAERRRFRFNVPEFY